MAPEGSGKTAALLGAGARRDAAGELYYWQEFTVRSERPAFFRHNLAGAPARGRRSGGAAGARHACCLLRGMLPCSSPTHDLSTACPPLLTSPAAVYAARNGLLYTLNCQAAEAGWAANEAAFRRAAESFAILNSGAATAGFPDRL